MADRILGRLLKPLEKVYRFVGAQKGAPDTFELDLPIQPVHDLSRMAGIRSSVGPINDGFWNFTARHVHAGAGTITSTPSPWTSSVANGFPASRGGSAPEIAWWIYNIWVIASNSNVSSGFAAVIHGSATVGPYVAGGSPKGEPLFWGIRRFGGLTATDQVMGHDADEYLTVPWPIRVMDNPDGILPAYMWYQSTTAGVGNVDFNQKLWFGPSGVLPPLT